MDIKQIYTKCLAQGSYYIESNGEAAVIDPLREVDQYLTLAKHSGAKIKYIFETHFHADFVSGHFTLSEKTNASVIFGPLASPSHNAIVSEDEQIFELGKIKIKALHTPGHTMESTCFLIIDEQDKEHAIFTGDTLFLGDVGRPDLAQKGNELTDRDLAGMLFESLRTKILPLPDNIIVYPGHGAGSACGKNMSDQTIGLLGEQKVSNYALSTLISKEAFIKELTTGISPPPAYFPANVYLNKNGYADVSVLVKENAVGLNVSEFSSEALKENTVILDVRNQKEFVKKHLPGSIFIGIDGGFAPWVGTILKDVKTSILLVTNEDRVSEVITRLSRVGFDSVLGYLKGGVDAWEAKGKEISRLVSISAKEFEKLFSNQIKTIDVRKKTEFDLGHVKNAILAPLSELETYNYVFNSDEHKYIHCAGGYRSVIAASILQSKGVANLINVEGGFSKIKQTEVSLVGTSIS